MIVTIWIFLNNDWQLLILLTINITIMRRLCWQVTRLIHDCEQLSQWPYGTVCCSNHAEMAQNFHKIGLQSYFHHVDKWYSMVLYIILYNQCISILFPRLVTLILQSCSIQRQSIADEHPKFGIENGNQFEFINYAVFSTLKCVCVCMCVMLQLKKLLFGHAVYLVRSIRSIRDGTILYI